MTVPIKSKKTSPTENIRPICLPNRFYNAETFQSQVVRVSGWGKPADSKLLTKKSSSNFKLNDPILQIFLLYFEIDRSHISEPCVEKRDYCCHVQSPMQIRIPIDHHGKSDLHSDQNDCQSMQRWFRRSTCNQTKHPTGSTFLYASWNCFIWRKLLWTGASCGIHTGHCIPRLCLHCHGKTILKSSISKWALLTIYRMR